MNKNLKQKLFNFKSICIFLIVIIILTALIFLFNNTGFKSKTEVIFCTLEINDSFIKMNIAQRVVYVDDVFENVEVESSFDILGDQTKSQLEEIKSKLEKQLPSYYNNKMEFNIEDQNLILNYSFSAEEYKKIQQNVKDDEISNNITDFTDNFYDDKLLFMQQIINQGGECNYE